jgi:hypothetical protein
MNCRHNIGFAFLALAIALSSGLPLLARTVTVTIKFPPGKACWSYEGTANIYVGRFRRGQRVTAQMHGTAHSVIDPNKPESPENTRVDWRPRDPSIMGPGNFMVLGNDDGTLAAVIPQDGRYSFGFSPIYMIGGFGRVLICAKP